MPVSHPSNGRVNNALDSCIQRARRQLLETYRESSGYVREFPRQIYVVFLLKFLESYSYFAVSQIIVIYMHDEFGVPDVKAGAIYGMWGAIITLLGICTSWLNDGLGVRRAVLAGFSISSMALLILAFTRSRDAVFFVMLFLLPLGECMGIPMLTIAVRRCTTQRNRGFAFGLYYSIMNVAALLSGPVIDAFNILLPRNGVQIAGVMWSGNRFVILTCACFTLTSIGVSYFVLKDIKLGEDPAQHSINSSEDVDARSTSPGSRGQDDDSIRPLASRDDYEDDCEEGVGSPKSSGKNDNGNSSVDAVRMRAGDEEEEADEVEIGLYGSSGVGGRSDDTISAADASRPKSGGGGSSFNPWEVFSSLCSSPTMWRFSALTLLLVNLHAIFRHLDATLPTYLVRIYGDEVPKGMIYSINPFMIIFMTPIIAAVTSKYNHFNMIKYGGYLTGLAPFFLAASTSIWAAACMVVFISLGEAIWSPRLYDYVMSIAPEGKEASFSALASAPLFAAKIPVGLMSGYLLSKYVPEDESQPRDPQMMWLIIGILTISSPILITIFDPCIREPERPSLAHPGLHDSSATPSLPRTFLKRKSSDESAGSGLGTEMSILHGQEMSDAHYDGSTGTNSNNGVRRLIGSLWRGGNARLRLRDGRQTVTGTDEDWRDDPEDAESAHSLAAQVQSGAGTGGLTGSAGAAHSLRQTVLGRGGGYSHINTESVATAAAK